MCSHCRQVGDQQLQRRLGMMKRYTQSTGHLNETAVLITITDGLGVTRNTAFTIVHAIGRKVLRPGDACQISGVRCRMSHAAYSFTAWQVPWAGCQVLTHHFRKKPCNGF